MKLKTVQETKNLKNEWAKAKSEGFDGLKIRTSAPFRKKNERGNYPVTMSSSIQDRHGEIVIQNFLIDNYLKNPVVVDSHQYDSIERIVGKTVNLSQGTGNLEGEIKFTEEENGKKAERLVEGGFINAVSIGFIPLEFSKEDHRIITKSELLELSLVSVPANPEALIKDLKEEDVTKVKEILQKEGRVLSETNRKDIESAIEYLNKVINKSEKQSTEEPKEKNEDKPVETPIETVEATVETVEEPTEEPIKEDVKMVDVLKRAIKEIKSDRLKSLNEIASELGKAHEGNIHSKKREIYKKLRSLKQEL